MMMKIDKFLIAALVSLLLVQWADAGPVEISQDNMADLVKGKNSFLKFVRTQEKGPYSHRVVFWRALHINPLWVGLAS